MRFFSKSGALIAGAVAFLMPAIALAQQLTGVRTLLNTIVGIVNILIPLAMALAVLAFFVGLVRFVWGGAGDATKKAAGRDLMIYGLIALFVMAAVWGLIQFIAANLGIGTGGTVVPPTVSTYTF
jgi:hypothetical protein